MNIFMDNKLFTVSIWGILPVIWAFMVFLCTIIIKCMKKERFSPVGEFCNKKNQKKVKKYIQRLTIFLRYIFL